MAALRVLYLGVSDRVSAQIRAHFKDVEERVCASRDQLELIMTGGAPAQTQFVIAGPNFTDLPLPELAQTLRMAFPETPVYFISDKAEGFDRTNLMKNGFMEVFLLPADSDFMTKKLAEQALDAEHSIYSPVRLVDIQPGTRLDFSINVYLSANNRYLLYSAAGDILEARRLERLKEHKHNSVYVPTNQMKQFYAYSARRLVELTDGSGVMSETERQERLQESVRDLITGMLSESFSKHISQGKKVVESTRKIVSEYIMLANPSDWYTRLMSEIGQRRDTYAHASNVSTYAVLFSLLLKIGKPEDIAIASMFHDLGMNMMPDSIQTKRFEELTPVELEQYKTHPKLSLEIIKARRLVLPDQVLSAIAQHHERWDGSGFPSGLSYKRFSKEAQMLSMADRFDYLTRVHANISPLSPDQAFRQMEFEKVADPDLIRVLRQVFDRERRAAS